MAIYSCPTFNPNFLTGTPDTGAYLLMLDNNGQPVYYKKIPASNYATDFKVLSNGLLAYWEGGVYHLLDSTYTEVRTITPGNGYTSIDNHELLLLPNGDYMFIILDKRQVDMSKVVPGGNPKATVTGAIIQEVNATGKVVFQWNSFDHIPITDSDQDLTAATIDYIHANALELDNDGNLLLSSRHLDEITKIDYQTGDILWRLGGKANQFTLSSAPGIPDAPVFYKQHDVRRLPNGDISLFDDHNDHNPMISRALEFSLDEQNKTAELVWEYRDTPDVYSAYMGNVQPLPNGDLMIGWGGASTPNATEIKPDGTKVFELGFDSPYVNYRSFRFPWQGYPTWAPALVAQPGNASTDLTFSWNGATDIAKYEVYGGDFPQLMTPITEVPKSGFETSVSLAGKQADYCYYRVMPIDIHGQPTHYSNSAYGPACAFLAPPFLSGSGR